MSFFENVPEPLADEDRARERDQQGEWMAEAWPGRHPEVETRAILATQDRFFPAPFMRRQIRDRLGIEAIEIPGGHYVQLTHPEAIAAVLLDFAEEIGESAGKSTGS